MVTPNTRRAFQVFHAVLALGLLVMSLISLQHALHEINEPGHGHLAFVMGLEALGALLLLIPRTVQWGGAALLVVLLPGFVNEVVHGDWEFHLLIYAAGVWFIMARGAAWGRVRDGVDV
ncbi:MAG TPA: hypothetical protein VMO47_15510 [Rhodothermales bacterium]|nr:hypothetical protein [Rhodothermales bacterium]